MSIWKTSIDLATINKFNSKTLVEHLGIKITKIGPDFLEGTMPVDDRTVQPLRLLHGGASCVLAESLGSIAANLCLDSENLAAVGQHIEATHIRSVTQGEVRGRAKIVHLGKSSQVWKIQIFNNEDKLVCDSKIVMAVIKKRDT